MGGAALRHAKSFGSRSDSQRKPGWGGAHERWTGRAKAMSNVNNADLGDKPFVLIHGAWHGGWVFSRVAEILRRQGHRVFTPTLTGLGERSHTRSPGVNCTTHAQDIVNTIKWEGLDEVVLCGWSYGGSIAGMVADVIPERIGSLIYLDCSIPENGKSILEQQGSVNQVMEFVNKVGEHGGLWVPPMSATAFAISSQEDQDLVDSLSTPHPFACFCERFHLTGAYMAIAKIAYVHASQWGVPSLRATYDRILEAGEWSTYEVSCGHHIMLDEPERLAEILVAEAERIVLPRQSI